MPKNPKTVRVNWTVKIQCVDCGEEGYAPHVDPSVERLEGGIRMALITFPNECPTCHNLRVVKEGEPQP